MKRFYKAVSVHRAAAGGWQVTLDGRGVKSVGGSPQEVQSEALARTLAQEWEAQGEALDPASFVARAMVDYAIDVIAANPAAIADKLLTYGDTDTLLYRADPEDALYVRQLEIWEPIVTAFEQREGIALSRVSGIVHRVQSDAALAHLRARLCAQGPIALAGIEAMTTLSASLMIGLSASAADSEVEALALWQAACLEEEWQADLWGRDEEAEERRAKRQADFLKAREITRLALG
ncbi:ATP12 family chaperone protein [Qipengyuania sp. ASV99]|uniref:ATP12 family chaperone protein n=1 Tax=Qipengyuania sp. ASV99 TaxID=3399681 RepID=UPI003A4C54E6